MKDSLFTSLHARELSDPAVRSHSYRTLYSSRSLIADLDIVNELDGHSGCVNALSWSRSGNLLASGSDDQHLNIHTYQPSSSTNQFQLSTTVATGHTQNIFSVKFMPHHNDRTVITAAGDGEVRVFDLEYAGQAGRASAAASLASESRRRGRHSVYNGVRYMTDGDTDCRVYRSHGDRVKRIVTESSPHLFLTCSEDGEVRQWDLRQPSSAYPSPGGGRYGVGSGGGSVPPPLISYKRYNLDLNTISCSPSQPHYIALGGAHLHAFLHDRRMTGRDQLQEAGKTLSPAASRSAEEEELMSQATQCVRKFAPRGQQRMKRTENGHITACKISDARPDEMIVSWSGDHIYSFDLVRSPDASEEMKAAGSLKKGAGNPTKQVGDRKRKRKVAGIQTSVGGAGVAKGLSRPRTESAESTTAGAAALRVRYRNGQSEDIPITIPPQPQRVPGLTESQRDAQRIAKSTVSIRSKLFGSHAEEVQDPAARFTAALGEAAASISDIDEAIREWRYPMSPDAETVVVQQTLRRHRESVRRFVQGAGTLARVLGGKLQTALSAPSPLLAHFTAVEARSNDLQPRQSEQFGYDFLKAILLWLESGIGRLIEGFTRPAETSPTSKTAIRLPISENDAGPEAMDDILIPYLLRLASEKPIIDVEANRFEVVENRQLFRSEKAAVLAFAAAVRIPFADLSSAAAIAGEDGVVQAQDRQTALRFWGGKVARGVLLNAAEGVNFGFVERAFGGVGRPLAGSDEEDVSDGEEDGGLESVEVMDEDGTVADGASAEDVAAAMREIRERGRRGDEDVEMDDEVGDVVEDGEEDVDRDDEDEDDGNDNDDTDPPNENDETDSSEPDEIDGVPNPGAAAGAGAFSRLMFQSSFERRRHKERVEARVPCHPSTRTYRGHCNVRTVKDVNFFGLDDEFVVSGSDDGNLFIWDRKTAELVNVLEGDGEVVNVVQGHPYETMLAVSGIDHTIKIFSPDARARAAARLGQGVGAVDASGFSSIAQAWPVRGGRRVPRRNERRPGTTMAQTGGADSTVTSEPASSPPSSSTTDVHRLEMEEEDEDYVAPTGLASRKRMHDAYRIMNNNDVERQGGSEQAYVTVPHAQLLQLLFGRMGDGGVFSEL